MHLFSVMFLRGGLRPLERDIRWFEEGDYGWFGLPLQYDFAPELGGVERDREIETFINERRDQLHLEIAEARRLKRENDAPS